jgi:hypothetical protein
MFLTERQCARAPDHGRGVQQERVETVQPSGTAGGSGVVVSRLVRVGLWGRKRRA